MMKSQERKHSDEFEKLSNEAQLEIDRIVFGFTIVDELGNRIDPRTVKIEAVEREDESLYFWN